MKNRILCRLMSMGMAVLLALGAGAGRSSEAVYAAEREKWEVKMTQKAYWTEEENSCGELAVEITGLKEWLNGYKKEAVPKENVPKENENKDSDTLNTETDRDIDNLGEEDTGEEDTGEENTGEEDTGEENIEEEDTEENIENEEELSEESHLPEQQLGEEADVPQENSESDSQENSRNNRRNAQEGSRLSAVSAVWRSEAGRNTALQAEYAMAGSGKSSFSACTLEKELPDIPEVMLVTRLSGYFQVEKEKLPADSIVQEKLLSGKDGGRETATEIICPVSLENPDEMEETMMIKIPFTVREEYRYGETVRILPVLYLGESETTGETDKISSAGIFLAAEKRGETTILGIGEQDVTLEAAATPADYTLNVNTDQEKPKAGQPLKYFITVTNTGGQPLPLISLEWSTESATLAGTWASDREQETDISGQTAILSDLKKGESRKISFVLNLPEGQSEPIISKITAKAQKITDSGELLVKEASLKTAVTPLKADFSVSKSADRTIAAPGDTITYQICIRNTGERTLHSVLSTERFQAENISARFVEKEGVVLNASKTQALISQIPPGEVFSLDAVVILPEKLNSQELINQVLVRAKETGDKLVESTSEVKIRELSPTAAPTEGPGNLYGGSSNQEGGASSVSDHPRTSDDANPVFWAGILVMSALAGAGLKAKSKH